MYYVYILESKKNSKFYIGSTINLRRRLDEHNSGGVSSTNPNRPHRIVWYCAYLTKKQAYDFEKYLKSGSGKAFLKKRLI